MKILYYFLLKRKFLSLILSVILLGSALQIHPHAATFTDNINAKSAILIEAGSGTVLFEQDADKALAPASVTKIMTLLLVMEAVDEGKIKLSDNVTVSSYASSMGGSQIFLKEGEVMTVEDLIKSVVVASANDAAVALAEYICGSEASFVNLMNERAAQLKMNNTHFENTNGLDDSVTNHLTSSRDIAIMSQELLKHEKILDYTSIWQDSIRDGAFVLSNTNRLIRFYEGANGLKTGSTSKALFCISATAKRDNMQLICVIMGSPTRDIRNAEAKKLLDFGFANFSVFQYKSEALGRIGVVGSDIDSIGIKSSDFSKLLDKSEKNKVKIEYQYPDVLNAPISENQQIGKVIFKIDDQIIGESDIVSTEKCEKISFSTLFYRILLTFTSGF